MSPLEITVNYLGNGQLNKQVQDNGFRAVRIKKTSPTNKANIRNLFKSISTREL